MIELFSSLRRTILLSAIFALAAIALNASAASAQVAIGSAQSFAVLAGTAVTCTNVTFTGNVGVWPGTAVTPTGCTVVGTVHAGDAVAQKAYLDFVIAYNNLRDHPPVCKATVTATLTETLTPGVYCTDATAKVGPLILDARGNANASWIFLVDGALTGTNFNVVMINGGQPCNVTWWVKAATTLTDSKFLGTILAGAAITVTRGSLTGHALATAAATLTGTSPTLLLPVSACTSSSGGRPPEGDKCEEHHDRDGDDHDKDRDHHDNDRDHHDNDRDHHDNDRDDHDKDRDHHDKDKDNDRDHNDNDRKH